MNVGSIIIDILFALALVGLGWSLMAPAKEVEGDPRLPSPQDDGPPSSRCGSPSTPFPIPEARVIGHPDITDGYYGEDCILCGALTDGGELCRRCRDELARQIDE